MKENNATNAKPLNSQVDKAKPEPFESTQKKEENPVLSTSKNKEGRGY